MNKIFRIVWSHATQSWVAVSELTKAHKKQSRNSLKAAGAVVLLSMSTAEAANVVISDTTGNAIANTGASAGDRAVAIGPDANAGGLWCCCYW